ncbi:EEF1A lysine methyltransferase 4-like [Clytia hemisphaerica]|uniref:Methyltransferase domain-containing protein n=1 Tax=Clytia hemisphaerica TaxID=252671 RepID=A0A7M5V540_9CNID
MMEVSDRVDRQKYRTQEYWEERFQHESQVNEDNENSNGAHEWFSTYHSFSHIVTEICPPDKYKRILVPGNGNSSLCAELVEDYPKSQIIGEDFSPSVIQYMSEKYNEKSNLSWFVGDIRDIQLHGASNTENLLYDMIIEKGVIDALVAGSKSPYASYLDPECLIDVEQTLLSIRKSLHREGRFLSISFASPMIRLPLLSGVFEILVHSYISEMSGFEYYVYECINSICDNDVDFRKNMENEILNSDPVDLPETDPLAIGDVFA